MFGHNGGIKAHALGLPQAGFQVRHAAHFPAQTHFTNGQCFFRYRQIQQTGRHCQADRQIAGSLVQFQAADDVDVDILIVKGVSGALFQHGQQQIENQVEGPRLTQHRVKVSTGIAGQADAQRLRQVVAAALPGLGLADGGQRVGTAGFILTGQRLGLVGQNADFAAAGAEVRRIALPHQQTAVFVGGRLAAQALASS